MCICVCGGCLNKYIRVAIWSPQTKIPGSAPRWVVRMVGPAGGWDNFGLGCSGFG